MFAFSEQLSAASKASIESNLALLSTLTGKAFESIEKAADLHVTALRATLEESGVATRQLLAARDTQEWLSLATAQAQPSAEKALSYGRQLAGIAAGLQAECSKITETHLGETSRKMLELVEELSKHAPPGSENVVTLFRSAVGNANAGYEQLTKTTRQAVEVLETNLTNSGTLAPPVVKAAARAARKA